MLREPIVWERRVKFDDTIFAEMSVDEGGENARGECAGESARTRSDGVG
jgi:hypothetical protein